MVWTIVCYIVLSPDDVGTSGKPSLVQAYLEQSGDVHDIEYNSV